MPHSGTASQTEHAADKTQMFARTQESHRFEAMWRALSREGHLPQRSSFRPERAGRLLTNIVLLEINPGADENGKDMTTRIRLLGGALRDLSDHNVTGFDYLDLVPDRAYQSRHLMTCLTYPCAAWSLTPIVYERGYNSLVEVTNFPLIDDATKKHLALVLMIEIKNDLPLHKGTNRPLEIRPAVKKTFIDIGTGIPEAQGF